MHAILIYITIYSHIYMYTIYMIYITIYIVIYIYSCQIPIETMQERKETTILLVSAI